MKARVYLILGVVGSVVAIGYVWSLSAVPQWETAVLLGTLTFIAVAFSFELPVAGSVSLSFAIDFAAVVFGGPVFGALVSAMGAVSPQDIREKKPLLSMAFNAAQLATSALVAGLVYVGVGGTPLASVALRASDIWAQSLPALAAALALHLTNILLVGVYFSLKTGLSIIEVWRQQNYWGYFVSFLFLALLGLVLAYVLKIAGLLGVVLLALPFILARQTFMVYLMLAEAYSDTVRSLVTAIEAKDVYTRGHSERVAAYTSRIARQLGYSEQAVHRIELAALMHDLGKIGIRDRILNKPGGLDSDEYEEVRRHPQVGSRLLEQVEYLADVSTFVRSHHERLNGSGYPDGLLSEQIPTEAKLLAVADSFDAMTSTRAYRQAMTVDQAIEELYSVVDVLLDRSFVDALCAELGAHGGDLRSLAGDADGLD